MSGNHKIGWSSDSRSVALHQLYDLLSCRLCSQIFENPRMMPTCGHTFCCSCLLDKFQGIDMFSTQTVPCPTCDLSNPLYSLGAEGLPSNIVVKDLAEFARNNPLNLLERNTSKSGNQISPLKRAACITPVNMCEALNSKTTDLQNDLFAEFKRFTPDSGFDPDIDFTEWLEGSPEKFRSVSSASSKTSENNYISADCEKKRCCNFFVRESSIYCDHCQEVFCKRCSLMHLELVRDEVLKISGSLMGELKTLPDANIISNAAGDRFNKMTNELERFEQNLTNFLDSCFESMSQSLKVKGVQVLTEVNAMAGLEMENLEKIVIKISHKNELYEQIEKVYQGQKLKPLINCNLQSVSCLHRYLLALEKEVNIIRDICSASEMSGSLELKFAPSDQLHRYINTVSNENFPVGDILKSGFSLLNDGNRFNHPVSSRPPSSVGNSYVETEPSSPFTKEFYESLKVGLKIAEFDHFQWMINRITACCVVHLPGNPLIAIVHNGSRISLIDMDGQITHTFRIRTKDEVFLGDSITANRTGSIFVTSDNNTRILTFNIFNDTAKPKAVYARTFVQCPSTSDVVVRGLKSSEKRREMYILLSDVIIAYSVADASERFRIRLEDPAQKDTSFLQTVCYDENHTYLIVTSFHGKHAFVIPLPNKDTVPAARSVKLPLSKWTKTKGPIDNIVVDPRGNLVVQFQYDNALTVFSSMKSDVPIAEWMTPNKGHVDICRFDIFHNCKTASIFILGYPNSNNAWLLKSHH